MDMVYMEEQHRYIAKDQMIFYKGTAAKAFTLIVQGSVIAENGGIKRKISAGEMIGVFDVMQGKYLYNYQTTEDTEMCFFQVEDIKKFGTFFRTYAEYSGNMVHAMCSELQVHMQERNELYQLIEQGNEFLKKRYVVNLQEGMKIDRQTMADVEGYKENIKIDIPDRLIKFYEECLKVSLDAKQMYYAQSDFLAFYQVCEVQKIICTIRNAKSKLLDELKRLCERFYDDNGRGLYQKEFEFVTGTRKNGKFKMEYYVRINQTKDQIVKLKSEYYRYTGQLLPIDVKDMEQKLTEMLGTPVQYTHENIIAQVGDGQESNVIKKEDVKEDYIENVVHSGVENTLQQIFDFGEIDKTDQERIREELHMFAQLEDKMSVKDDVRMLKKNITNDFFLCYKKCIIPWILEKPTPIAVKLFLNYGMMDETLLTKEQIEYLLKVEAENRTNEEELSHIYTMAEWLREIYHQNKMTSRNSFENDFRDELRQQKKYGKITALQEKEYLEDPVKCVEFEIDNMFVSNNKIVNGKLTTYVALLFKEEIYGNIENMVVKKRALKDSLLKCETLDFSIFYHEVMYRNLEEKIEKEYVLKKIYPDIIIAPVYGVTSSMWQEIEGKKRDTAARFVFPSIIEDDLYKSMIKACGRYRWEYCRCEQGTAWNNIQYKSLTSEYMDYIQYYRKNRDLTEEKREKLRNQILHARNNSREVFLIDYENWMNYESRGAMKLNKVSRGILATYCPFNRSVRENIAKNTVFADAMAKQGRNYAEKAREWEYRMKKRENNNLVIPEEFHRTYEFYLNS